MHEIKKKKQASLSKQFGLTPGVVLGSWTQGSPQWDPEELTTSFAFSGATHVSLGLFLFAFVLIYLLNTQSHTVVQLHVSTAWFIFRLQPPSVV